MASSELNSNILFRQVSEGDHDAFGEVFRLYFDRIYAAIYHYTKSQWVAEELVQEVFISCWRHRHLLADIQDPTGYLYRMAFNHINNYLKKLSSERKLLQRAADWVVAARNGTLEQLELQEMQRIIAGAVDRLPPQKKIIYELSREQGLNYQEIADKLELSPNTVKNHLVEAMKLLRKYLKEHALALGLFIFEKFR